MTKSVLETANRSELLDLRLEAHQNEVKVRVCDGDLVGAEKSALENLADASRIPDPVYLPDAYARLSAISRLRLRLRESRERAEKAMNLACELVEYPTRCLELRSRLAYVDFANGRHQKALEVFTSLAKKATGNARVDLQRRRALVLSELGSFAEARTILSEVRTGFGTRKVSTAVILAECIVESEAHDTKAARRVCGPLTEELRIDASTKNLAKAALAQALYWGGDPSSALRLATDITENKQRDSAMERFPALLVRAAAERALAIKPSEAAIQVRHFIQNLNEQNGVSETAVYLQKRPIRDLLREIGFAPTN